MLDSPLQGAARAENDSKKIRVLLIDDHELICDTVTQATRTIGDLSFEAVVSLEEGESRIQDVGPFDVILLDYKLPGIDGLEGLEKLVALNAGLVALFSGIASRSVVERALDAGARGFLPKALPLKTLVHAIRFIADGEVFLPAEFILNAGGGEGDASGLKTREMKVLGLLCQGLPNKEIGREIGVDESIVKLDVKSICRKLGARNRTQAVIEARNRGLF